MCLFAVAKLNFYYMKSRLVLLTLLVALCVAGTSCASSKAGCKMSQSFVGYGSGRR